jgi:hypothetical protein
MALLENSEVDDIPGSGDRLTQPIALFYACFQTFLPGGAAVSSMFPTPWLRNIFVAIQPVPRES